ncbi:unnamed protein product [Phytophthora fragariaefolia]|uniref:Unnamed protein product n=1 Tax=Phytophthora fragariaefolia TaxID=1490495 RepID=A0A9W6UE10_9STRA|nr:unnamed protein product [Phytophthora fragariaefolia]
MAGSGSTPSTPTVTSSGQGASTAAAATPVMTTAISGDATASSVASGAVAGLASTGAVPGPGASAGGVLGAVSGYGLPRAGMAGGSGTLAVPTFYGGGDGIGGFNFGSISTGLAGVAGYGSPRVGMATAPVKMDNVPKMKGSFGLFAVQFRTFLTRMDCWSVVDGTFDQSDPLLRTSFEMKDNVVREAILSGVPAQDAEMICHEETAFAMWNLYSNVYSSDKGMDSWPREMESLRRQLLHYGKRVSDEDYAETLLGHVARTHRDVVRQFSKRYVVRRDGGADRPVPTATQVTVEWALDSASDVHVSNRQELLTQLQNDEKHVFLGYDGAVSPSAPDNLLSHYLLEKAGWNFKTGFTDSQRVAWLSKGRLQLLLLKSRGRYRMQTAVHAVYHVSSLHQRSQVVDGDAGAECTGTEPDSLVRWQLRFAHLNLHTLKQMAHQRVVTGMSEKLNNDDDTPCWSCHELLNNKLVTFLTTSGIEYTWTNGYSPEENGLVERMNGIVAAQVRCILTTANTPNLLWGEAFGFAVEVRNISATKPLNGETPYFRRFRERPDVSKLRTWGCVVFVFTPKKLRKNKLENPGNPSIFMGFVKHSFTLNLFHAGWLNNRRCSYTNCTTSPETIEHILWDCERAQGAWHAWIPSWLGHHPTQEEMNRLRSFTADRSNPGITPDFLTAAGSSIAEWTHELTEAMQTLWLIWTTSTQCMLWRIRNKEIFENTQICRREAETIVWKAADFQTTAVIQAWTSNATTYDQGFRLAQCYSVFKGVPPLEQAIFLQTWIIQYHIVKQPNEFRGPWILIGPSQVNSIIIEAIGIHARPASCSTREWIGEILQGALKQLRQVTLASTVHVMIQGAVPATQRPNDIGIFNKFNSYTWERTRIQEVSVPANLIKLSRRGSFTLGKFEFNSLPPRHQETLSRRLTGKKTAVSSEEHPLKCHRCDGDSAAAFNTEVNTPVSAGAPVAVPLSCPEVTPPTAVGDRSLVRGVNPPRVRRAEAEVGQEMRGPQGVPNSHLERAQQPETSRGTSPSVEERVVGGEVDEVDPADTAREEDDLEEKMAVPIASGDHQIPIDEVANALSDSGSDEDEEEECDTAESIRRLTSARHSNPTYADFEVDLPARLVIEAVNALMEPQTVQEALKSPDADKRIEALEREWKDLMRNNTWELVERPKGKNVLSRKWKYGVDFWETYSPVVAQEAVKFILLLALHLGLNARNVDFVTAFLNGPIDDDVEIYMEMPEYFDDGSGRVCRTLDKYLRQCGFRRTKMDGGVYTRSVGSSPIFVAVYVVDLVIVGTDENIELALNELRTTFQIKDLGPVTDLLHMQISDVPGEALWISQRGYIDKVLRRFGMEGCRPVTTPQAVGDLPGPGEDEPGVNDPSIPYRQLVGCLQYLVQGTRPEIANAVRTLGKYMSKYTKDHYVMAKRVLRYLQGTRDYGLLWMKPASPDLHFTAYADADLGSEKEDRRSITGSCFR